MMKPQLFMFHFAGGNCYSYNFLKPYLQDFSIEIIELPGRGKRFNENLLTDFELSSQDLYKQIKSKLISGNFLLYGHSMGALLAFQVAKILEKDKVPPISIIVSGNPGPGIKKGKETYLLENEEFIEEVKKLGGLPQELIDNRELLEFFVPILKADFEVAERNEINLDERLDIPVYAMMGTIEERMEHITNWAKYTSAAFNYELLEGDHFFIYNTPNEISRIIKQSYSSAVK